MVYFKFDECYVLYIDECYNGYFVLMLVNREVRCDCLWIKDVNVGEKWFLYVFWKIRVFSVEVECNLKVLGLFLLCFNLYLIVYRWMFVR